jgi:hypothetical protein
MNRTEASRLLTRYVDGDLSAGELRQFMDAVRSDQDLYNAFAEEAVLAQMLEDPAFEAEVRAAVEPAPRGIARIAAFFRNLNPGWQLAGAALVVTLALVSVLLFRASRHAENIAARGAGQAAQEVPAPLSLLLVPGVRGAGEVKNAITPAAHQAVRLFMDPGEGSYAAYRIMVESANPKFQREFTGLKPRAGGGRQLVLEIPPGVLQPGDYTVSVFGLTPAGGVEPTTGYSFSVAQKK